MSDQYTPPTPTPARPTIAGAGLDPNRSDYRADPSHTTTKGTGGFSTGALVAIVFVVVAIIAGLLFSNRAGVSTATDTQTDTQGSAPATQGMDPVAPTPAPTGDPVPADPAPGAPAPGNPAPADPATPPVQAPAANP